MAKVTGTQNVPSALLDLYRGTLGEQDPKNAIGKRYPYRVPTMQTEKGHPTVKQLAQRTRFKTAVENFAGVDASTRARWYAAEPPWSSFLWYYNYFIMSDLNGNANTDGGGFGVIKSIQHKEISMPAGTGEGQVAITAIDAAKAVVMLFGATVISREAENWAQAITVYPYLSSIAATLVKCKWATPSFSGTDAIAATISITVIEYI